MAASAVVINAPVAVAGEELVRPARDEMNRELAEHFPNVMLLEIDGADHVSIITDRVHADRVSTAVLDLHRSVSRAAPSRP